MQGQESSDEQPCKSASFRGHSPSMLNSRPRQDFTVKQAALHTCVAGVRPVKLASGELLTTTTGVPPFRGMAVKVYCTQGQCKYEWSGPGVSGCIVILPRHIGVCANRIQGATALEMVVHYFDTPPAAFLHALHPGSIPHTTWGA